MKSALICMATGFILTVEVFAQNPWIEKNYIRFGYGRESYVVNDLYNNFDFEQIRNVNNSPSPLEVATNNSFSYNKLLIDYDLLTPTFYFHTSITNAGDLLFDNLRGFAKTGDNMDIEAQRLALIPLKMNFGFWIADRIGLYAGGQYQYSRIEFKKTNTPDQLVVGGNIRGFNALTYVNLDPVLLRFGYDYDWVRHSKRAAKGNATTIDFEVIYRFEDMGIFAGYKNMKMLNTGPSGEPTEDWTPDVPLNTGSDFTYEFPDLVTKLSYVRFGLVFMI